MSLGARRIKLATPSPPAGLSLTRLLPYFFSGKPTLARATAPLSSSLALPSPPLFRPDSRGLPLPPSPPVDTIDTAGYRSSTSSSLPPLTHSCDSRNRNLAVGADRASLLRLKIHRHQLRLLHPLRFLFHCFSQSLGDCNVASAFGFPVTPSALKRRHRNAWTGAETASLFHVHQEFLYFPFDILI
jgi:hypothetical protein